MNDELLTKVSSEGLKNRTNDSFIPNLKIMEMFYKNKTLHVVTYISIYLKLSSNFDLMKMTDKRPL